MKRINNPKVSLCVVSCKHHAGLIRMLDTAVKNAGHDDIEIVIHDNSFENWGCPRAINSIAKRAKGDILVFFSDDGEIKEKDWLKTMLEAYFKDEKLGLLCRKKHKTKQGIQYGLYPWMVDRNLYWAIGGCEESMGWYGYEDIDFCLKMRLADYWIEEHPMEFVEHPSPVKQRVELQYGIEFKKLNELARHWFENKWHKYLEQETSTEMWREAYKERLK